METEQRPAEATQVSSDELRRLDDALTEMGIYLRREQLVAIAERFPGLRRESPLPDGTFSTTHEPPRARLAERARFDADGTAKPLTEILAVMPESAIGEDGKTVHIGQATHYVARPTGVQTTEGGTSMRAAGEKPDPVGPLGMAGERSDEDKGDPLIKRAPAAGLGREPKDADASAAANSSTRKACVEPESQGKVR